jgi:hypothetical protein
VVRRSTAAAVLVVLGLLLTAVGSPAERSREHQMKAAFLFKFISFVEWPSGAFTDERSPFTVGVAGPSPVLEPLAELAGKRVGDRVLVVQAFPDAAAVRPCHLLFVSNLVDDPAGALTAVAGHPVLTVGESDRFLAQGGMINFVVSGDRLRFEIDTMPAREVDIRIGSALLQLAIR